MCTENLFQEQMHRVSVPRTVCERALCLLEVLNQEPLRKGLMLRRVGYKPLVEGGGGQWVLSCSFKCQAINYAFEVQFFQGIILHLIKYTDSM